MSAPQFKKQLDHLRSIRAEGARLISLYIPPGKPIDDVRSWLQDHYAKRGADDDPADKDLQAALPPLLAQLDRLGPAAGGNGAALFFGTAGGTLHQDMVEPPQPLADFVHKVDGQFFLDPLDRMTGTPDAYGILVLDLAEATVGYALGTGLRVFAHLESQVPNKHHHGGMSSLRFERLRDDAINEYFKKVADKCTEAFLDQGLKGIIVGGPAMTKDDFMAGNYLHYELRKKVLGVVDVGYTDENGLREAMNAAQGLLADSEYLRERKVLDRFWEEVGKDGLAVCGAEKTLELLRRGQVDSAIVSEGVDRKVREEIAALAGKSGARVVVVGEESDQGRPFTAAVKVGGILRYK